MIFLASYIVLGLAQSTATVTVDTTARGKEISPMLYGIFFEEINRAGDGGIYAEMLQNRSFEDADNPLGWSIQSPDSATMTLDKSVPLNPNSPTSLCVDVKTTAEVINRGFVSPRKPDARLVNIGHVSDGIRIEKGKTYNLDIFVRAESTNGKVSAKLVSQSGTVLASQEIGSTSTNWKRSKQTLKSIGSDNSAYLVISFDKPGKYWIDGLSLMPTDTWNGRANGLRPDLLEAIEKIKPAFVRFPGGCFVEGYNMANAFRWKNSIGDISERKGHRNLWGYYSTNGLGYLEYLEMCEDLKAEPLFVINVGMAHEDVVPMDQMGEFVQDALDAIEYANGPVTSKWGALRAQAGHPKPFGLKYMEIGNENGGPRYHERYRLFHDAIKAKYPEMQLIACDWGGYPTDRPIDYIDSHNYSSPVNFLRNATRYDSYPRTAPKVYFGEYAVTEGCGLGNVRAAIGEAAFMTGLERNGDIVRMSSYAPLLSNEPWKAWNPNAIIFDQARSYGTPSYWVQTMFSPNTVNRVYPTKISQPASAPLPYVGQAGFGTYNTQAEFKDFKIEVAGKVVAAQSDLKTSTGDWTKIGDVLKQTGGETFTMAMAGASNLGDCTISLKAMKTGGVEGFFIYFGTNGKGQRNFWNIGGWGNTEMAIQGTDGDSRRISHSIESNRWYDLKVVIAGPKIECYLDGKLMQTYTRQPAPSFFASVGKDDKTGDWVLKLVNAADKPYSTTIDLAGLPSKRLNGSLLQMANADPFAENSFTTPNKIRPRLSRVNFNSNSFNVKLPANSVSVYRLK